MAYHSLKEHVEELLRELAYWESPPSDNLPEFAMQLANSEAAAEKRKKAADDCRKEIADAAATLQLWKTK